MDYWPGTLPQTALRAGYTEDERDTVIRSAVGYGPAKLRSRTTVQIFDGQRGFHLDDAQKTVLEIFYTTNKALTWAWDEGQGLRAYRFIGPPVYREITCNLWLATLRIEVLPGTVVLDPPSEAVVLGAWAGAENCT